MARHTTRQTGGRGLAQYAANLEQLDGHVVVVPFGADVVLVAERGQDGRGEEAEVVLSFASHRLRGAGSGHGGAEDCMGIITWYIARSAREGLSCAAQGLSSVINPDWKVQIKCSIVSAAKART